MSTDRKELSRRLEEHGLGRVARQLVALAQPRLRLRKANGTQQPRSSHLGGTPDLPRATAWPQWNDRSLAFLAQIRLEDLPAAPELGLPRRGLLAFFYDQEQSTWGFAPADRGSCQVIHSPDAAACEPRDFPADVDTSCRYAPVPVEPVAELSLPSTQSEVIEPLALTEDESDALVDLAESGHWLAGYPAPVQNDTMELECAITAAGVYCGDGKAYEDARLPEWKRQAKEWQLLLQLDSDDDANWMWGDMGCLYFWVRKADLTRADFRRVWLVLQCG
ncbi:MAG TPA: YwqG family protein [Planctomycetota bacterium]